MMKKSIGILGGMGPLATADLFQKIVLLTDAAKDNDHIRIYIDNNASIPDRTAAILNGGTDPVPEMEKALRSLEKCGADCIVMPCNTAHYFLPHLQAMTQIPFLSILESTAKACSVKFPGKTAAILGTKGTLSANLYQSALDAENVPYVVPNDAQQDALMRVIYEGVKAGRSADAYGPDLLRVIDELTAQGADFFILGCTELPLAAQALTLTVPMIDPTEELARSAIRFCGYPEK